MKVRTIAAVLVHMLGVAALLFAGAVSAADVHVMISAGFYEVYAEIDPAFERASAHRLVTTRGPPSGEPVAAVVARGARQAEAAGALLRFLSSPEATPVLLKNGLAPIPAR